MAVIKQQRTTFASPIGVVRANTGAGAVFRGVNKIADQMIEESFRSAKEKALEAGEDLARSKELGSLRSINPATGLPEMSLMSTLAPPQEFGSIAQKAYKRVIESRYVSQIEQDFKLKAKELYIEHKDDPIPIELERYACRREARSSRFRSPGRSRRPESAGGPGWSKHENRRGNSAGALEAQL